MPMISILLFRRIVPIRKQYISEASIREGTYLSQFQGNGLMRREGEASRVIATPRKSISLILKLQEKRTGGLFCFCSISHGCCTTISLASRSSLFWAHNLSLIFLLNV